MDSVLIAVVILFVVVLALPTIRDLAWPRN
jgi:hypothetical protein